VSIAWFIQQHTQNCALPSRSSTTTGIREVNLLWEFFSLRKPTLVIDSFRTLTIKLSGVQLVTINDDLLLLIEFT